MVHKFSSPANNQPFNFSKILLYAYNKGCSLSKLFTWLLKQSKCVLRTCMRLWEKGFFNIKYFLSVNIKKKYHSIPRHVCLSQSDRRLNKRVWMCVNSLCTIVLWVSRCEIIATTFDVYKYYFFKWNWFSSYWNHN